MMHDKCHFFLLVWREEFCCLKREREKSHQFTDKIAHLAVESTFHRRKMKMAMKLQWDVHHQWSERKNDFHSQTHTDNFARQRCNEVKLIEAQPIFIHVKCLNEWCQRKTETNKKGKLDFIVAQQVHTWIHVMMLIANAHATMISVSRCVYAFACIHNLFRLFFFVLVTKSYAWQNGIISSSLRVCVPLYLKQKNTSIQL